MKREIKTGTMDGALVALLTAGVSLFVFGLLQWHPVEAALGLAFTASALQGLRISALERTLRNTERILTIHLQQSLEQEGK